MRSLLTQEIMRSKDAQCNSGELPDESIKADKQLHVDNYKTVRRDRNTGQDGGGCLIYIASHICYSRLKSLEPPDVELIWIKIMQNSSALILGNCYRPPSDFQFYSRSCDYLEKVWLNYCVMNDRNKPTRVPLMCRP